MKDRYKKYKSVSDGIAELTKLLVDKNQHVYVRSAAANKIEELFERCNIEIENYPNLIESLTTSALETLIELEKIADKTDDYMKENKKKRKGLV